MQKDNTYKIFAFPLLMLLVISIVLTINMFMGSVAPVSAGGTPNDPPCIWDYEARNVAIQGCGTCSNPPNGSIVGRRRTGEVRVCNTCTHECTNWTQFEDCQNC